MARTELDVAALLLVAALASATAGAAVPDTGNAPAPMAPSSGAAPPPLPGSGAARPLPGSGATPPPPGSAADRLTSPEFRPRAPGSVLIYDLLRVPELAMRLILTPTFPLVYWAEDVALDARVSDLLTNDAKTALLLPTATFFGNDAAGVGLRYTHQDLWGGQQWLAVSGSVKTNEDRSLDVSYGQPVALLDDRALTLHAGHRYDHNDRYYGIGAGTGATPRAASIDETRAELTLELVSAALSRGTFQLDSRAGYVRRRDAPGRDASLEPVIATDAPPGFAAVHHYAELTESVRYDLRDTLGRTGSGSLLELDLSGTTDLAGAPLSAAGAAGRVTFFVALGQRQRVLVLHAGTAGVTPWNRGDQVPVQFLVTLGRATYLRGYAERRFRDRTGWWSSVEYRYPIFQYGAAVTGASSTLFFDLGQTADRYAELGERTLFYSYGLGLRAETLAALVFRLQLGFSPEGAQVTLSLNEAYDRP